MSDDPLMAGLAEPDDPDRTAVPPKSEGVLRLLVASQSGPTSLEVVPPGRWTFGRSDEADVKVDDPSISRQHARLFIDLGPSGPEVFIEDLGSSNGTVVRGATLEPNVRVQLDIGEAVDLGEAVVVVQRPRARLAHRAEAQKKEPNDTADVVVADPTMRGLFRLAEKVAATDIPVLILGETGVGKEVLAERIHERSLRRGQPFVRLNCAALSAALLESELFGHEKGAFTGADNAKRGLLESANGGTVLLDEVGELPLEIQAKLLRAVEDRAVLRLGSLSPVSVDVRFVAATNRDLDLEIERGTFRRDLFYRLAGFTLEVPPLRDRPQEILLLARLFAGADLTPDAEAILMGHTWPGNVRELRNLMRRAALMADEGPIDGVHLPLRPGRPEPHRIEASSEAQSDDEEEKKRIMDALEQCVGNQTRAARMLGISRRALILRIERYGLPRPRKR